MNLLCFNKNEQDSQEHCCLLHETLNTHLRVRHRGCNWDSVVHTMFLGIAKEMVDKAQ